MELASIEQIISPIYSSVLCEGTHLIIIDLNVLLGHTAQSEFIYWALNSFKQFGPSYQKTVKYFSVLCVCFGCHIEYLSGRLMFC